MPKNRHAQAMVTARNKKLTPARRKEIASFAAKARWSKASARRSAAQHPQEEN